MKPGEIWSIRTRLQLAGKVRDLAMFNLAIDSKLRGRDLVKLRVSDVTHGNRVMTRAMVIPQKTGSLVRFELGTQTREALGDWIFGRQLRPGDWLFPSRNRPGAHVSTRQYGRMVKRWVALIGLDAHDYGAHSMRRTKATLIYRSTKNLRAVQLLLGHTKLESTVRYLGVEVEDALEMAEQVEI